MKRYRLFIFSFLISIIFGVTAHAGSLYLSPSSGEYEVGNSFTTSVYLSSEDQAANAVSSVVTYSTDLLEATAVSGSASVISLWINQPARSGSSVGFDGVIFNPGYTGSVGRIAEITFKAIAEGTAFVSISSGSVLANDGDGTDITKGLGDASFTIRSVAAEPPLPSVEEPEEPSVEEPEEESVVEPESEVEPVDIQEYEKEDPTEPITQFTLTPYEEAEEIVDHQIQIDGGEWQPWEDNETHSYQTPLLGPGDHTITIRTEDSEGNISESSTQFYVKPLDDPEVIHVSKDIQEGEALVVTGTTYPNSEVTIWLEDRGGRLISLLFKAQVDTVFEEITEDGRTVFKTTSDENGNFTFVIDERQLAPGAYDVWMKVTDHRGAQSEVTKLATVRVKLLPLEEFYPWILSGLAILIIILLFIRERQRKKKKRR